MMSMAPPGLGLGRQLSTVKLGFRALMKNHLLASYTQDAAKPSFRVAQSDS
jgi:hypothetical protein